MLKRLFLLILVLPIFLLSGCAKTEAFKKPDIKDAFCGLGIDARYCKCAFHKEYCDSIGMSKSVANKYVHEQYDKWVNERRESFAQSCTARRGVMKGNKCRFCDEGEGVKDGECVPWKDREVESDDSDIVEETENDTEEEKGECKYDSDCDSICEANVMWKMGCNPRENKCVKTFDTDCSAQSDEFGDLSFAKMCQNGECVRDDEAISAKKAGLIREQKKLSDELKDINARRDDLKNVMLDANKRCLSGLADMTNVAIMEFATRVSSIIAGGLPSVADVSVDYAGDALNKLYAYSSGTTPPEEQKLKPHEYIKLNCDLYNYFKDELAASDSAVDDVLKKAEAVKAQLDELP